MDLISSIHSREAGRIYERRLSAAECSWRTRQVVARHVKVRLRVILPHVVQRLHSCLWCGSKYGSEKQPREKGSFELLLELFLPTGLKKWSGFFYHRRDIQKYSNLFPLFESRALKTAQQMLAHVELPFHAVFHHRGYVFEDTQQLLLLC